MKIFCNIQSLNYIVKQNNSSVCNKFTNLAPLTRDTVSFRANSDKDAAVNLDLIEDKEIRKIADKVLNQNAVLDRYEILAILEYFNYAKVRNTGDEQYKHKYLNADSIFTLKAEEKAPKRTYTTTIKTALKVLNQTSGELFLNRDGIATEEEIAKFNESVKNCPEQYKNPYRLKLEESRQKQILEAPKPTNNNHNDSNRIKSCKKAIEITKSELKSQVYDATKEFIESREKMYGASEEVKTACNKAKEKLGTLKEIIDSLQYTDGDDYNKTNEKNKQYRIQCT